MDQLQIYIMNHNPANLGKIHVKHYTDLLVGAKESHPHVVSDYFPGGISEKNRNYSELTGQYYIWKKGQAAVVGFVHYRRLFSHSFFTFLHIKPLSSRQIKRHLTKHDVILPKIIALDKSVEANYAHEHSGHDFNVLREVIAQLYPQYLPTFNDVAADIYFYPANMLIASKALFDEYSAWLFTILFAVEKKVDISNYDNYQARIFGFMSERLMLVWMKHNAKRIKEVPIVKMDEKHFHVFMKKVKEKLVTIFRRKK